MTSEEKQITFGTPDAPIDKEVKKKIVKKETPKKKTKIKKICGYQEMSPIYRWTCELKSKHKGEHQLTPKKRIVPGLELKQKESTKLF